VVKSGAWQAQDVCRVMRGPSSYDTYKPSTRAWLNRYDESEPGWTKVLSLTEPNPTWFKFNPANPTTIFMLVNNRWIDTLQWMQQQGKASNPRTTAQTQPRLPAHCPPFKGPLIAPQVRENLPVEASCRTPEERVWNDRVTAGMVTNQQLKQLRSNCEATRASKPYESTQRGRDGSITYVLRDGSVQPSGGSLNPGWYWTATGPQMKACDPGPAS